MAIAFADFLVIFTGCILNRIGRIYLRYTILSAFPVCAFSAVLVYISRDGSVWLTVAFTIDRFVAIACPSLSTRYCTEKTALLVIGVICSLFCSKNIPLYFVTQPLVILEGMPWFCGIKPMFYTSPAWQAYHYLDRVLTPLLPFFLILLLNALTVRHILVVNAARRRLRGSLNGEDHEMAKRKRSMVLLYAISISFLLLWGTYVGRFLYIQITGKDYFGGLDFNNPQYILSEMTNMLQLLSSCNNVFIYAISQNKFREEMKKVLMCPLLLITSCFKCRKTQQKITT
ncbi:probable G-protein coupled receptor 139 [Hemiscyllium ocellatum]|uniref:probable G-protein coupled receptor 139 n=1 Tax=Hemiscyllium ocellatum TaxID=170820 RepID=UPI0029664A76|nr:probable G-protein coupled receptor 139 [Hemiscyllium ocellatum]